MLRKINSEEKLNEVQVQLDALSYAAPNPYLKSYTGIDFIDSILRSMNPSSSSLHSGKVGKLVLPAQRRESLTLKSDRIKSLENYQLQMTKVKITTFDNAEIDGIEINPEKKSDIYIIKFNGNGALFEDRGNFEQYINDAYRLNANVIAFNYRGVGNSKKTPESSQDLVTDGIAEVQRILDQGVEAKHIVLDGLSLGGGVATLVAKHFHDKGIKVNLFNDRSFSSVSNAGAHMALRRELSPAIEYSIETTSSSFVSLAGWQINAAKAYATIPVANKAYMYVTDDLKHPGNQGDLVIPEKASLHEALNTQPQKQGDFYKMTCGLFSGGHNASRKKLIHSTDKELNGEKVFDDFVRQVTR